MVKLRAFLVGATGIAGQQFVSALRDHPWFEIGAIAASPRNAGKRYDEAVAGGWFLPEPIPPDVAAMRLLDPGAPPRGGDLVFSAVASEVAPRLEPRAAAAAARRASGGPRRGHFPVGPRRPAPDPAGKRGAGGPGRRAGFA